MEKTLFANRQEETCQVYTLKGKILEQDAEKVMDEQLREALDEKVIRKVVFDLGGLDYINSSGINVLIRSLNLVNRREGKIVFACVPEKIKKLLQIVQINNLLTTTESVADAVLLLNREEAQ